MLLLCKSLILPFNLLDKDDADEEEGTISRPSSPKAAEDGSDTSVVKDPTVVRENSSVRVGEYISIHVPSSQ